MFGSSRPTFNRKFSLSLISFKICSAIFNCLGSNLFTKESNQSLASKIDFSETSLIFNLSIFTHKASSFNLYPLHFSHFVSD